MKVIRPFANPTLCLCEGIVKGYNLRARHPAD
jgi:hypothetical protein